MPQNREYICPVVYTHDQRLPVIIGFRQGDPIKRLARDAVLPKKETQLGGMFLHMTHGVQEQFYIAHLLSSGPWESDLLVRLLV